MRLVRIKVAQKILVDMSRQKIGRLIEQGELQGVKLGKEWRVDLDALEEKVRGGGDASRRQGETEQAAL